MGLVASVIGSTGVIGVITASVQLSRRARLKRSIAAAREVADAVAADSRTRRVLQQAIETDILRLAAMSMVTLTVRVRLYAYTFIAALAASVVLSLVLWLMDISISSLLPWVAEGDVTTTPLSTLSATAVFTFCLVVPGAILLDLDLQSNRERLVVASLIRTNGLVETPEMRSYKEGRREFRRAQAARRAKKAKRAARKDAPG